MIQYLNYKKEIFGSTLLPWVFLCGKLKTLWPTFITKDKASRVVLQNKLKYNCRSNLSVTPYSCIGVPNLGREGWEILFNPKSNQGTVKQWCWTKKKTAFWGQIRAFDSSAIKCQFQIQGRLPSRTFPQVVPICTFAFQWQELNDDKKKVCKMG